MRTIRKKIFLSSVVMTGALAVGAIGVLPAYAQSAASYPPVVQKLADRFGLDVTDVQEVFDEAHADRQAQMLTNFEDRLTQAVADGKITEEQKQAILGKHEEFQAKMDELKGLDPAERRQKMQELHDEMKSWADSEEIDLPLFGFEFGSMHGVRDGFKMGMHAGS